MSSLELTRTCRRIAALGLPVIGALLLSPKGAKAFSTLHAFIGDDGFAPASRLTPGPGGVLYGVTLRGGAIDCGAIFSLTPPAPGSTAWVFATLYDFPTAATACRPVGGLAIGPGGDLYGATSEAVFKLGQPATPGGAWQFHVLQAFNSGRPGELSQLNGAPVLGQHGVLYGTAGYVYGVGAIGAVYALSPPSGGGSGWTSAVIYQSPANGSANAPAGSLLSLGGALYGIECGSGYGSCAVVVLSPPAGGGSGAWQESVLAALPGAAQGNNTDLVADATGTLYGTSEFGGAFGTGDVYSVAPPAASGQSWTYQPLYSFAHGNGSGIFPLGGVALEADGSLRGTLSSALDTKGNPIPGQIYRLNPPSAGQTAWTSTVTANFDGALAGGAPAAGLVIGGDGAFYGTAQSGGAVGDQLFPTFGYSGFGYGTVFRVLP